MSPRTHSSAAIAIQTPSSPSRALLPSNREPAAATTHWKVIPTVVGGRDIARPVNQALVITMLTARPISSTISITRIRRPSAMISGLSVKIRKMYLPPQAHQHRHPDTRRNRNLQCRIHSFLYIIRTGALRSGSQHNLGCRRDRSSHKHNQYWQNHYNIPWLQ